MLHNFGFVFVGSEKKAIDLPIMDGARVLQALPPGHEFHEFQTLHLDLLLVQMLLPNVRGLPLIDLTSAAGSLAVYTYTKSGGHNWAHVLVEEEECCVLQLLGLTQFSVVPRNPRHEKPIYILWGYGNNGVVATFLFHGPAATAASGSASDPIVL